MGSNFRLILCSKEQPELLLRMSLHECSTSYWTPPTVLHLYLDVGFTFWHWSKVLQDLVVEADLEVLEPDPGLVVHCVVQFLQSRLLLAVLHLTESLVYYQHTRTMLLNLGILSASYSGVL